MMRLFTLSFLALCFSSMASAQTFTFPERQGERPQTTMGVPHVQLGFSGKTELSAELAKRVAKFPGVTLGPTRVSLPGAIGFQLDSNMALANPNAIVGGREFAHMHPDGSLHASLEPGLAQKAVAAGWAIPHPWADKRAGWDGFVMIYSPQNMAELDVVTQLVEQSYLFITGNSVKDN